MCHNPNFLVPCTASKESHQLKKSMILSSLETLKQHFLEAIRLYSWSSCGEGSLRSRANVKLAGHVRESPKRTGIHRCLRDERKQTGSSGLVPPLPFYLFLSLSVSFVPLSWLQLTGLFCKPRAATCHGAAKKKVHE